jgi:hypothetical protein
LFFQPKMLDHPRDHWSRLQAGTGIIEEDCLLAPSGIRTQLLDVPTHWHSRRRTSWLR